MQLQNLCERCCSVNFNDRKKFIMRNGTENFYINGIALINLIELIPIISHST